jgi:hypothetical protein
VKFRLEDHVVVAEDVGGEVGRAELRTEGFEVWVEHLYAFRPGVEEPLLREALAQARELERAARAASAEPSFGRVYVQTDDEVAVERAVRQFVPRLGRSARTEVAPPNNGWIAVDDELCSREPSLLRRLARELSDRTGAVVLLLGVETGAVVRYILFDRGRIADEYASVPEYHGPLPPGDVVALAANPTVASRLTGADPAEVRAVARTAATPSELPPARELHDRLAEVLGVASGGEG